jgi:ribosome-binding factor A
MSRRIDRIEELIQQEMAQLIQGLAGFDQGLITVTSAEVTPDLHWADIWVSIYHQDPEKILVKLNDRKSEIQGIFGRRLRAMKSIPHIRFKLDQSSDRVEKIDRLLKKVGSRGKLD